jgi:hypothetical protein
MGFGKESHNKLSCCESGSAKHHQSVLEQHLSFGSIAALQGIHTTLRAVIFMAKLNASVSVCPSWAHRRLFCALAESVFVITAVVEFTYRSIHLPQPGSVRS